MLKNQEGVLALLGKKKTKITLPNPNGNNATFSAKVLWSTGQKQWTMIADQMPAAPADKSYQLWFILNNKKISGGIFTSPEENSNNGLPPSVPPPAFLSITIRKTSH